MIINEEYTRCIDELKIKAKELTNDLGNPFFRVLQILEHLKKERRCYKKGSGLEWC
jgi:hypothetical protein